MRVFIFVLLCAAQVAHAFEIPKGLNADDRRQVIRTIGLNSAYKTLSNPYPLGGYSGFEIGYSVEFVSVSDIRRLGCKPGDPGCSNTEYSNDTDWRYSRLTIGKGLYNDIDVFFSFIPPAGNVRLSDYGGMLRWSFYQAKFLPINLAAMLHFNNMNFNNTFMDFNSGAELMAGVNIDNFALYFGGGVVQARGTFIAAPFQPTPGACTGDCTVEKSDPDYNTNTQTVSQVVTEGHTVIGFSAHYENLFAAAEVDRYRDAVYSLKVGLRF